LFLIANLEVGGENSVRTWIKFLFFHFAIYNCKCAYLTLETQPLLNLQVRNGLCSVFGNGKMKKWRRFVNTILPLPMLVRQSLHNLQRRGAFIATFTSEK
jgi:hypothetical protein